MFYHLIGANAAQSVANLHGWLAALATRLTCGNPLVDTTTVGVREPGLFQGMKCTEHCRLLECLNQMAVTVDCLAAGLNAGRLYSLEPAERGQMQIIALKRGFFL